MYKNKVVQIQYVGNMSIYVPILELSRKIILTHRNKSMDVYVTSISKSAVCCKNLLYSEKLKPAFAKNLNAFCKKLFLVIRKHFAKFCSLKS